MTTRLSRLLLDLSRQTVSPDQSAANSTASTKPKRKKQIGPKLSDFPKLKANGSTPAFKIGKTTFIPIEPFGYKLPHNMGSSLECNLLQKFLITKPYLIDAQSVFFREWHFAAPKRRWAIDLAWPEYKVGIEIEGGSFGGRHTSAVGFEADMLKYNEIAAMGWAILRIGTIGVRDEWEAFITKVETTLRERGWTAGEQHARTYAD